MRKNKPTHIIYHHNGGIQSDPTIDTSHHTFEDVNAWHKQLWPHFISQLGFHIGYHWYIDYQGKATQGRKELEGGAHCVGMNELSISIGLAGNFDRLKVLPNSEPSEAQKDTFRKLVKAICSDYNIPIERIVGHRHFSIYKTCPGRNLDDDWAQKLLEEPKPAESQKEKLSLLQQILKLLQRILLLKIRLHNLLAGVFRKNFYA